MQTFMGLNPDQWAEIAKAATIEDVLNLICGQNLKVSNRA